MERLGTSAGRLLRDAGAPDAGALAELAKVWPAVTGPAIARASWPRRIARDGTLHVATVSSTWAYELDRLSPELLARLRSALGDDAPTALRFAPGPVPEPPLADAECTPRPAPQTSPDDVAEAAALTVVIADEELRCAVARAAAAALARARSDRDF